MTAYRCILDEAKVSCWAEGMNFFVFFKYDDHLRSICCWGCEKPKLGHKRLRVTQLSFSVTSLHVYVYNSVVTMHVIWKFNKFFHLHKFSSCLLIFLIYRHFLIWLFTFFSRCWKTHLYIQFLIFFFFTIECLGTSLQLKCKYLDFSTHSILMMHALLFCMNVNRTVFIFVSHNLLAHSTQVGKVEAERFFNSFQQIHNKLVCHWEDIMQLDFIFLPPMYLELKSYHFDYRLTKN